MLDVYFGNMDGVEVHAETPEEEQEAAFILNSALSGKTTFLGGCLCPSEADSTVSKGFRLMLSEGTDLYVTPETSCQGLFNQIHRKATKKVPGSTFMLLTLRQVGHLRPLNSSSQRHAYSGNWSI